MVKKIKPRALRIISVSFIAHQVLFFIKEEILHVSVKYIYLVEITCQDKTCLSNHDKLSLIYDP